MQSKNAKPLDYQIAMLKKEIASLNESCFGILDTAMRDARESYLSGVSHSRGTTHDPEGYLIARSARQHQINRLNMLYDLARGLTEQVLSKALYGLCQCSNPECPICQGDCDESSTERNITTDTDLELCLDCANNQKEQNVYTSCN